MCVACVVAHVMSAEFSCSGCSLHVHALLHQLVTLTSVNVWYVIIPWLFIPFQRHVMNSLFVSMSW